MPGHRQDARGEAAGARRDRRHPGAGQAARQVPGRAGRGHAPAGLRAQARPQALRRARRRLARRAARGRRGGQDQASCAASASRPRSSSSRRSPSRRPTAGPAEPARVLLSRAEPIAEEIVAALRAHPAQRPRRGRGLAAPPRRLGQGPRHHRHRERPGGARARARRAGARRVRAVLRRGGRARDAPTPGMKIDLKVVEPDQFGNVLQHFTGSKAHNVALRENAVRRGLHVSEYGILDDETRRDAALRDRGAGLRAARAAVDPARAARGPRRAGGGPRRRPARARRRSPTSRATCTATRPPPTGADAPRRWRPRRASAGYEYLAITDHSASHGFGNDVSPAELERRIEEIRALNEQLEGIEVLIGTESNILTDGSLDYPDELLERLDWVIASVHTSFRMGAKEMTERMVAAIEHPLVDAIGHPTGPQDRAAPALRARPRARDRGGRRAPARCSRSTPRPTAATSTTSTPARPPSAGVPILIDSDAHSTRNLRAAVASASPPRAAPG